jgi:hypothetical protein
MRIRALLLLVVGVGCSGEPIIVPPEPLLTCTELEQEWAEVIETAGQDCVQDSDCAMVGSTTSCDCEATISDDCAGTPVNRSRYEMSAARQLETEFTSRCWNACDEVDCICDCAPLPVGCDVERGVCVTREDDICRCLCPPPDAGLPDAAG